jgi:protein-tyrosine-phosphatase
VEQQVLFLCTGNSARSILAEALLARAGAGRFRAFSAGSAPKHAVHPEALRLLQRLGYETGCLRSKSWNEFAAPGAPRIDLVITVCDGAAAEACPVWPGRPAAAHWGMPDPAAATGSAADVARAFEQAYQLLSDRIGQLLALPVESLDAPELRERLAEIGRPPAAPTPAA